MGAVVSMADEGGLTDSVKRELIARARGKSTRQVNEMIAHLPGAGAAAGTSAGAGQGPVGDQGGDRRPVPERGGAAPALAVAHQPGDGVRRVVAAAGGGRRGEVRPGAAAKAGGQALWCREAEGTEAHRIRGADWRCTVPASNCRCCAGCGGRSCFCAKVFHSLGSVAAAGQRRQSRRPPARYGHPYHSGGREAAHLVARSGPVHVPGPGHRPPLRIPAPGADRSRAAIRGGRRRRAGQPQTSLFSPQPGPVRQTSGRARRRAAPSPG